MRVITILFLNFDILTHLGWDSEEKCGGRGKGVGGGGSFNYKVIRRCLNVRAVS